MTEPFYAGHPINWIQEYLNAIPKNSKLKKPTAYAIACTFSHLYRYKKSTVFKLSRKLLKQFGINRKCLKPYLEAFRQNGLIEYQITPRKTPKIKLILHTDCGILTEENIKDYIVKKEEDTTNNKEYTTNDKQSNTITTLPYTLYYSNNIYPNKATNIYHTLVPNRTSASPFWDQFGISKEGTPQANPPSKGREQGKGGREQGNPPTPFTGVGGVF